MTNIHQSHGICWKSFYFLLYASLSLVTSFNYSYSFWQNNFLPSVCKRAKRTPSSCLYSILHVFSHITRAESRSIQSAHIQCEGTSSTSLSTSHKSDSLFYYGSEKFRGLLFCWGCFVVVFKHFCDEILEDTPLMASHWRKLKSLGQASWSVSWTDIHKGRPVPEGSFPQFMANCHISLSSFLSFKQRKSWVQLWKYLPHTLGKLFPYFMGNDPSREQMRQHDPFSAGEAKGVWASENKMTHQSVLLLRIFIGITSCLAPAQMYLLPMTT